MLLDHAGIGMAQLRRDHRNRHAAHRKPAGVGMAQTVEAEWRIDPGCLTSRAERALLLGFAHHGAKEQTRAGGLSRSPLSYKIATLLGQHDMARLAALAGADPQRASVGVEVIAPHRRELAIAAAGKRRGRDQCSEISPAGIDQPARLVIAATGFNSRWGHQST